MIGLGLQLIICSSIIYDSGQQSGIDPVTEGGVRGSHLPIKLGEVFVGWAFILSITMIRAVYIPV